MSLLYKDKKDMTTFVDIENCNGVVDLLFSKDSGKFGTNETLDQYKLTPERLLQILQDRDDYSDDEL